MQGAGLDVPLVGGGWAEYANLDHAASAPCLTAVAEHVARMLPYSASVHRGAGFASQVCTTLYEGARRDVARFVGARDGDLALFTRNTTDAVNLLARCLPAADAVGGVVVFDVEHHANLLPWRARAGYRSVAARATLAESLAALEAELSAAPTALLAVTGASNVTGETPPLARLARMAHRAGARIFVDAAQLAPHRRLDMAADNLDYLAFSGHKLYAPFGAGVLVGRPDWLDAAPPYLAGGGAVREVGTCAVHWATGAARHEAGTPNLAGATAIAAACRTLAALPPGAWERHESSLRARLLRGLTGLDGVVIHRIWSDAPRATANRAATSDRTPTARRSAVVAPGRGRTRSASSRSRCPGTTRPGCRRTCRPSTASGCAPAGSARIRCWTGSARRVARCGQASAWARLLTTSTA